MSNDTLQAAREALSHLESEAHSLGMRDEYRHHLAGQIRAGLARAACSDSAHVDSGETVYQFQPLSANGGWRDCGMRDFAAFQHDELYDTRILYTQPTATGAGVPEKKPLPELLMASYHEVVGWNAAIDAMLTAAPTAPVEGGGVPTNMDLAEAVHQAVATMPPPLGDDDGDTQADHLLRAIAPYTHPHKGEQAEWVRCDERLPTEADVDTEGNVWARVAAHNEVSALPPSIVQVFSEDGKITHWMPTGLKRPAPPTEREDV